MTGKKKLRINSSGFNETTKSMIKENISRLGGIYEENLTFHTNYLLTETVLCPKYRIATILKLKVLRLKWLEDSTAAEKFLPYYDKDEYELKTFQGLTIGTIGFNEEQTCELSEL
jgi:hypothetical protein